MSKAHVCLTAAIALSAACGNSLGPGINGRWAATGIELVTVAGGGELRLPCVRPVPILPRTRFDANGRIQFAGAVRELWYNYDFVFTGQLRADTLDATLTVTRANQAPAVTAYLMTPNADSGLDRVVCLV
jgi:hypothetical protein